MKLNRALEQHIAVFGESGSGKTVMLSSFYGAAQESQFLKKSLFRVVANDIGLGGRLHKNYLRMRDSARLPGSNLFAATSYSFSIKLKNASPAKVMNGRPFDALSLVWHDYPGQWFEQDVSGPEEAQRRVDTFRSLLGSDVALLLVDSQRLLDNFGQEKEYLKSLLTNFGNTLLTLKDDLLENGKPLVEFPRIWVMALSKSDLLPDLDVFGFRDLLVAKAAEELDELRQILAGLVEGPEALSVGEDFVLLSSAKFDSEKIEVTERVGMELMLPLAAILPLERHVRWAQAKQIPVKVAENLLKGASALAGVLLGIKAKSGPIGLLLNVLSVVLSKEVVDDVVKIADDNLKAMNADALAKKDNLRAMLTGFQMDLDRGEAEQILLKSL